MHESWASFAGPRANNTGRNEVPTAQYFAGRYVVLYDILPGMFHS
jgi:hypothetical protein